MRNVDRHAFNCMVQPVPVNALASLYGVLSGGGRESGHVDPVGWTLVFAEAPEVEAPEAEAPAAGVVEAEAPEASGGEGLARRAELAARRMIHFGVSVIMLTRSAEAGRAASSLTDVLHIADASAPPFLAGVYLLGGPLHGWWLPDPAAGDADLTALLTLMERTRLQTWQGLITGPPELEKLHKPGSDSTGVVQFRGAGSVVAKIGPRDVIESESDFVATANAHLEQAGLRPLFPRLHGVEVQGRQASSLMEAAESLDVGTLFADEARTRLASDAGAVLGAHLDSLAQWYRLTAEPGRPPTVADYLYRERFTALRQHPAFTFTFAERFPGADLDHLLDLPVLLPGGVRVAGYTEATQWLEKTAGTLLPSWGSSVHGDIYMSNMLVRGDGSPVFIDPRTIWDGRDRPDPGYGDPVFDLATLLHGLHPMAAILHAVATGRSESLLLAGAADPAAAELDLSSLTLPTEFSTELAALEERLREVLPVAEPVPVVRARMYIGAAASLAGWLKYDRSLRTPESWLATYAHLVQYLARAKAVCDNTDRETTP